MCSADPAAPVPAYHPAEELLLDFAAGATSRAETLLLATHLAYCKLCRRAVQAARAIGGALLDTLKPARLPPDMLTRTLAVIEADRPAVAPLPSLSAFLGTQLASTRWRRLPGGFRMRRIPGHDGPGHEAPGHERSGRAWLFDSSPGMKLLPHRHVGDEWTVILSGVFLDGGHAYHPGDFALLRDGQEHRPKIGFKSRCVSLIMVREAPRYTTPFGRLAAPFIKL